MALKLEWSRDSYQRKFAETYAWLGDSWKFIYDFHRNDADKVYYVARDPETGDAYDSDIDVEYKQLPSGFYNLNGALVCVRRKVVKSYLIGIRFGLNYDMYQMSNDVGAWHKSNSNDFNLNQLLPITEYDHPNIQLLGRYWMRHKDCIFFMNQCVGFIRENQWVEYLPIPQHIKDQCHDAPTSA